MMFLKKSYCIQKEWVTAAEKNVQGKNKVFEAQNDKE